MGIAERDPTFRFGVTYHGGKFDDFDNHRDEREDENDQRAKFAGEALN
jgi:alpha-L-fucosidase